MNSYWYCSVGLTAGLTFGAEIIFGIKAVLFHLGIFKVMIGIITEEQIENDEPLDDE
jgi:hypothetical protein